MTRGESVVQVVPARCQGKVPGWVDELLFIENVCWHKIGKIAFCELDGIIKNLRVAHANVRFISANETVTDKAAKFVFYFEVSD